MTDPQAQLESPADALPRLRLSGEWTLHRLDQARRALAGLPRRLEVGEVEASGVAALDSAGALLWLERLPPADAAEPLAHFVGLSHESETLLRLVAGQGQPAEVPVQPENGLRELLGRTGAALEAQWRQSIALLGFVGLSLGTLGQILIGRRRLRLTATAFHMEQTGLDAVPIVALLSFLIGSVVAFLGATVLRDFGAQLFTVELVSVSFLREFGPLLTAILLAGRSGSAFTAQIGSMKSREEVDAIRSLGMDPVELLVVPRLLALLVMLPLLSFVATLAGILGGALVGSLALDISPVMFVTRLQEMTDIRHLWVGLVKAPVFAFLIAVVGCLEGFKVEGSAESVGRHTTSSVVQSIFLVILFDAMFAIFFMELDL
ncbi:MlaE family ABC transporter permease [Pseudomarimonas salicorniae]|uniref:ABC transporter permease n=1 Tax=Pseudomarimonas salicorniae TaxID=2933270 RepID=A0ABT0GHK3_9GAMM|nr:ABC transporter permease [Lysobacter sp. CAU 1642]MCK7594018.1 ABC transporter permease [Lysobacter sp. CAU 1642]